MSRYRSRLESLEQQAHGDGSPLPCVVYGNDADVAAGVATFRTERNWPDDGFHSVQVIRVVYPTHAANGNWIDWNGQPFAGAA